MRYLYTLIFLTLCTTGASAQSGWYMSTGVGFSNDISR